MNAPRLQPLRDPAFEKAIKPVARRLLGQRNRQLSTSTQWRFGNHGSIAVEVAGDKAGTWFDHERHLGGGVMDLVREHTGLSGAAAMDWLRAEMQAETLDIRQSSVGVPTAANDQPDQRTRTATPRLVATYDYLTADGELQFQVCRYEPKTFRQRRPDPENPGGWLWTVKGMDLVPYRLPELLTGDPKETVFVCEGEKDVDALRAIGLVATCNAAGAGKWYDACTEALRGRHVVILPDNDTAGVNHAALVTAKLRGAAKTCRTLPLPGLPDKGDVSDWLAAGGTADKLRGMLAPVSSTAEPFDLIWMQDLHPVLDTKDFVQGLLCEGSAVVVYGESNAGKTFWVTDLALHVAAGLDWNGRRVDGGPVVYCALEGGAGFDNRVVAWAEKHGKTGEKFPFASIRVSIDMLNPEADTPRLIATLQKITREHGKPKLVIIDTLSRAIAGGNENASEDMGALVKNMDRIRQAIGCCVLFIHHSGKDVAKGARGHSLLRAAVDTEIEVKTDHETGVKSAKVVKQREMSKGEAFSFALEVVELGQNRHGEPVTTCVVVPDDRSTAGEKRMRPMSADTKLALNVLRDALLDKGKLGYPDAPKDTPSMPADQWREIYYGRAKPGASQDTKQKAFRRASDSLMERRLVAMAGSQVWIVPRDLDARTPR